MHTTYSRSKNRWLQIRCLGMTLNLKNALLHTNNLDPTTRLSSQLPEVNSDKTEGKRRAPNPMVSNTFTVTISAELCSNLTVTSP